MPEDKPPESPPPDPSSEPEDREPEGTAAYYQLQEEAQAGPAAGSASGHRATAADAGSTDRTVPDFEIPFSEEDDWTEARRIGPYTVIGVIARGGMAVVYRVRSPDGRTLALKVIEETVTLAPGFVERFAREGEALRTLSGHPHIIDVFDVGRAGSRHYIAMELMVEGGSLAQRLREGPLPVRKAVEIARDVAAALAFAHDHGIVHRDLKPSNILLDAEGRPRLTDFGLARVESGLNLTVTETTLGTPQYMSPEQTLSGKVDARSDQYSLGVVLYEMVTGRFPYVIPADAAMGRVMEIIRTVLPAAPRRVRKGIPRSLQRVIMTLLEKAPADRYPSMHDVVRDLQAILAGKRVGPRGPSMIRRLHRTIRRHPKTTAAILGGVLLAAGVWYARRRILLERIRPLLPVAETEALLRRSRFENVMLSDPEMRFLLKHARFLLETSRPGDAIPLLRELRNELPTNEDPQSRRAAAAVNHLLARAYIAAGRPDAAIPLLHDLAKSVSKQPDAGVLRFEEGIACLAAGREIDAERVFRNMLIQPGLPPPLRFLCRTALGEHSLEYALRQARAAPSAIRACTLWLLANRRDLPEEQRTALLMELESSVPLGLRWLAMTYSKAPGTGEDAPDGTRTDRPAHANRPRGG